MNEEIIKWDNLRDGIHLSLDNAEYFLKMATQLHAKEEFQLSIPCAILAFEESSKADHLDKNKADGMGISEEEWEQICGHKYKLTESEKQTKKSLDEKSNADVSLMGAIMQEIGLNGITDKETAIMIKKKQIEIYSRFSIIKERCFYTDWDERHDKWKIFTVMSIAERQSLSRLMMTFAKHKYLLTKFGVESHENPFRKPTREEETFLNKAKEYMRAKA
ncbi:MAG: AbiV family abortive infection protein, partial [Nitrosotalea sp.]